MELIHLLLTGVDFKIITTSDLSQRKNMRQVEILGCNWDQRFGLHLPTKGTIPNLAL